MKSGISSDCPEGKKKGGSLNVLVPFCSTSAKSGVPLYLYIANLRTKFPEGQSSSQPGIIFFVNEMRSKANIMRELNSEGPYAARGKLI